MLLLQSYIELSKVYEAKHNEDVAAVAAHVATTLQQHNLPQVRPCRLHPVARCEPPRLPQSVATSQNNQKSKLATVSTLCEAVGSCAQDYIKDDDVRLFCKNAFNLRCVERGHAATVLLGAGARLVYLPTVTLRMHRTRLSRKCGR